MRRAAASAVASRSLARALLVARVAAAVPGLPVAVRSRRVEVALPQEPVQAQVAVPQQSVEAQVTVLYRPAESPLTLRYRPAEAPLTVAVGLGAEATAPRFRAKAVA